MHAVQLFKQIELILSNDLERRCESLAPVIAKRHSQERRGRTPSFNGGAIASNEGKVGQVPSTDV